MSRCRYWLIGYDIADAKRLGRVHRFVAKHAMMLQYSIYRFDGSQTELDAVVRGIGERIKASEDDVRIYPMPSATPMIVYGKLADTEGIFISGGIDLQRLKEDGSLAPVKKRKNVEIGS